MSKVVRTLTSSLKSICARRFCISLPKRRARRVRDLLRMPGIVALNIMSYVCVYCCCCYVSLLYLVMSCDVICVISILSCVRVCECVNETGCNVRNCSERVRRAESLSTCNCL